MITRALTTSISASFASGNPLRKVKEYAYLLHIFNSDILSGHSTCRSNTDFQILFSDFFSFSAQSYGTVGGTKLNHYFDVFDDLVANPSHRTMSYVLNRLLAINHHIELSYASKMLHMFDNDLPIWDSWLIPPTCSKSGYAINIHFKDPFYGGIRNKSFASIADAVAEYNRYVECFNRYKSPTFAPKPGDINGADVISIFRSAVSPFLSSPLLAHISDSKAIDFVLWQDHGTYPGGHIKFGGARAKLMAAGLW